MQMQCYYLIVYACPKFDNNASHRKCTINKSCLIVCLLLLGPHPGMGPMGGPGPGPMRMHGPPGPHMGPPRPGFMQGPGPMPGPMHSGGMYGVSSGESYKEKEEAPEKVEEKPKVIYASAPVITVQREKKEKKKKKKKGDAGEESKTENEGL